MKNIIKYFFTGLASAVLAVGLAGCGKPKEPKPEDYKGRSTKLEIQGMSYCLEDIDNDGKVDGISRIEVSNDLLYIAPGYENKGFVGCRKMETREMTPEIRDAASRAKQGIDDLGYEVDRERYAQLENKVE